MKSVIFVIGLLLFEPQSQSKMNVDGGMSGGGGFVINPETTIQSNDPQHVRKIIKNAALPILKNYFSKKLLQLHFGDLPLSEQVAFEKLFSNEVSIFIAMDTTKVVIEKDASCYGLHGEPTDGSFFSSHTSAICLSAFTIAKRVAPKDLGPQSAALMVHEYSEVLGLTDDEATEIQKIVLMDLKNQY